MTAEPPPAGPDAAELRAWLETLGAEDRSLVLAASGLERHWNLGAGPDLPALASIDTSIGIAVSGGGDSLTLLHLLARSAPQLGIRIEAATVDHCLRDESPAEAAFVGQICAGYGIAHRTLIWSDHPDSGNLMAAGSQARRRMLAAWAQERGLDRVAMAHTADDQAESFLMALARGTGIDGLCGMRPRWQEYGMTFTRPLLDFSRQALRDYLTRHGHRWIDDPSNDNDRYTRVRARKAMQALAPLGITSTKLNEAMGNLGQVRDVLLRQLGSFVEESVHEQGGVLDVPRAAYLELSFELQRRLLSAIIRWMSGASHAPRAEQLLRLAMNLRSDCSQTLGGCRFRSDGGQIRVMREARAMQAPVQGTMQGTMRGAVLAQCAWDNRWLVQGPMQPDLRIAALGEAGLAACPDWRAMALPRAALLVSPAVWRGDALVAAPLAGFGGPAWTAETAPSFRMFVLSH